MWVRVIAELWLSKFGNMRAAVLLLACAAAATPTDLSQQLSLSASSSDCGLDAGACPGSGADDHHAACSLEINFEAPCSDVELEVASRVQRSLDRKSHPGQYIQLRHQEGVCLRGSRTTGPGAEPGPFTDLFGFSFVPAGAATKCTVTSCSESQVRSSCDFSTNFCNLFNLFCNSDDGCAPMHHELRYRLKTGDSCVHGDLCGGAEVDTKLCTR